MSDEQPDEKLTRERARRHARFAPDLAPGEEPSLDAVALSKLNEAVAALYAAEAALKAAGRRHTRRAIEAAREDIEDAARGIAAHFLTP